MPSPCSMVLGTDRGPYRHAQVCPCSFVCKSSTASTKCVDHHGEVNCIFAYNGQKRIHGVDAKIGIYSFTHRRCLVPTTRNFLIAIEKPPQISTCHLTVSLISRQYFSANQ